MYYSTFILDIHETRIRIEEVKNQVLYGDFTVHPYVYPEEWHYFVEYCIHEALQECINWREKHKFFPRHLHENYLPYKEAYEMYVKNNILLTMNHELSILGGYPEPIEPIKIMILEDTVILAIRTRQYVAKEY